MSRRQRKPYKKFPGDLTRSDLILIGGVLAGIALAVLATAIVH